MRQSYSNQPSPVVSYIYKYRYLISKITIVVIIIIKYESLFRLGDRIEWGLVLQQEKSNFKSKDK